MAKNVLVYWPKSNLNKRISHDYSSKNADNITVWFRQSDNYTQDNKWLIFKSYSYFFNYYLWILGSMYSIGCGYVQLLQASGYWYVKQETLYAKY